MSVQVLTSLGCTPCTRIKRILKELQVETPSLLIEEIDFTSPDGTRLATEHNILYPPAVFLDGKLIAKGKIDADRMVTAIRGINGN